MKRLSQASLATAMLWLAGCIFGENELSTQYFPDYVELETGQDPQYTIIWLHGLGADGHDFEAIVPELKLPADVPVRFIFPHAPERPITLNGGMVMRGWYDIYGLEFTGKEDEAGFRDAESIIHKFIEQERKRGILPVRIILAGFSQGGAAALYTGLRYPETLAGMLLLSTYLSFANETEDQLAEANRSIPIFMAHGQHDPLIPLRLAQASVDKLQSWNYSIEWHTYPMQHAVSAEEISHVSAWITSRISG